MKFFKKIFLLTSLAALLIISLAAYFFLSGNVVPAGDKVVFYIPTGASYKAVKDTIESNFSVKNKTLLYLVAEKKGYPERIKPGRYVADRAMSYSAFINMLRSGNQAPVRVTFNNIRTVQQLAGRVGKQIEADSATIADFLLEESNYRSDGFTASTIMALFIPDTYEMYWNSSAGDFYGRMLSEYKKFWNQSRISKAEKLGLTPMQVSILASIIDDEVRKADEKPRIAGVYLNRVKRGMPLQACPTIKFALNDFTITRVLTRHLKVDSPYNTYTHKGFPPGPIGCPSREGLEAVLNAEEHNYLFFAAKPDFSGYHNFSRTLAEHNRYANEYQKELDRRRIFN